MKNKILKFSKGDFRNSNPIVMFEETNIVMIIGEGEIFRGSLRIKSGDERAIRGLVYSSSFRMHFRKQGFDGTDVRLEYSYDGRGLRPGFVENSKITVVCVGGEYELNVTAIIEKPYIMTSYGKVQTTDDFRKLAMKDFSEASRLFRSKSFYDILKYENERTFYLYDNMRKWSLGEQGLEEFLVGIKQKECIFLTLSGEGMLFEDIKESSKASVQVMKNTWGYIPIQVSAKGEFLKILKPEISTDEFVGNTYELEYIVRPEALHLGLNFGKIIIKTPYEELSYDVEVLQPFEYDENHHMSELMMAQIMKEYINFSEGKMDRAAWAQNATERFTELRKLDPMNERYQLYQAHVYVINQDIENAKWILENFNYNRFAVGKDPIVNSYYLFLTALIRGKSSHTERVLDEIGKTYTRYQDNWQLLLMLIHLDGRYKSPMKRLEVLEQQYEFHCNQVLFYLEAYQCYKEKPGLLKKLGKFEMQVINFASKYRIITKELALYVANLASQSKRFREDVYRVLVRIYDLYPEDIILNTICVMLIKGNKTDKKYFRWYRKAVESGMKIAKLYEYFMLAIDIHSSRGALPRTIFLYFMHGNSLDYKTLAFLYANLLTYRVGGEDMYMDYRDQMIAFTWKQLEERRISEHLKVLYKRFCSEEELTGARYEAMREICYSYAIKTKVPGMNYVRVIEKDGSMVQRIPYDAKGETIVCLKDKESRIVWEAINGHIYTDSIPYETKRLFYEPRFLELFKHKKEKEVVGPKGKSTEEITYDLLKINGVDYFETEDVFKFVSRQVREVNYLENAFLVHLCHQMFIRDQYDTVTLKYLEKFFCGATKEMRKVWEVAGSYELQTYKIAERIITQMVFSENLIKDEDVFKDYYLSNNAYFRLKQAYLALAMREYLVQGRETKPEVFEIIIREASLQENLADVCKIGTLQYYSQHEYEDEMEFVLRNFLRELCEKQMVFPFYQKYPEEWLREVQLFDKTIISYQAQDDNQVKIYYKFRKNHRDELGYRHENMLPTYENIYVRQCVLFEDEEVTYYIEESNDHEIMETPPKTIKCRRNVDSGKFAAINKAIASDQKSQEKMLKKLAEETILADEFFVKY